MSSGARPTNQTSEPAVEDFTQFLKAEGFRQAVVQLRTRASRSAAYLLTAMATLISSAKDLKGGAAFLIAQGMDQLTLSGVRAAKKK